VLFEEPVDVALVPSGRPLAVNDLPGDVGLGVAGPGIGVALSVLALQPGDELIRCDAALFELDRYRWCRNAPPPELRWRERRWRTMRA